SFLLFKEKLHRKSILGIILAFLGVIILFSSDYFYLPKTFKGDLLAFLGGIFAGTYIIGGRKIRQKVGIFEYNFIVYGMASIFLLILCLLFKMSLKVSSKEFTIFLLMAVFPTLLGHSLFMFCIKYVKATVISVSFLGEPIGSSILATILFREVPGVISLIGGVIILLGIYLVASSEIKNI
ncbi:MAG: DMT family transporter, partial [Candidatus Thermoplasmatota archaeon]